MGLQRCLEKFVVIHTNPAHLWVCEAIADCFLCVLFPIICYTSCRYPFPCILVARLLKNKTGNVVQRNIEARSRNHCCNGKAMSITQPECICSLRYSACNVQYCHLWPSPFYIIFPLYLIKGTIFEKEWLNTKCVFWFSLQLLSETFLIIRRNKLDMINIVYCSSCKVSFILVRF
jgi:hypothetical protein